MPSDMMSTVPRDSVTRPHRPGLLPCHDNDPDLWFAEAPADLERAKTLCASCPVRARCLAAALDREEPWGVWGGEILDRGVVVARKRPRGRPRKNPVAEPVTATVIGTSREKELVCV